MTRLRSSSSSPSDATSEVVLEFHIVINTEVHTSVVVTSVKFAAEACRLGMIREVSTNYCCLTIMYLQLTKEAMMSPNSVKWLGHNPR